MKRIATANRAADLFGPGKDGFKPAVPGVSDATYLNAVFCNAVQEALVRTIEAAELAPSDDYDQFMTALDWLMNDRIHTALNSFAGVHSITSLPTANVGPIIVAEASEVWTWTTTPYFNGYRSPLCGRVHFGHTAAPLVFEVDAVGGTLSKTAYARLWAYAQENGLVVASASWTAGTHYFVDLDGDNFMAPDLRNQFLRMTGTDADTANVRALGSRQLDALQNITGTVGQVRTSLALGTGAFSVIASGTDLAPTGGSANQSYFSFDASRVARTSTETRSLNTAYYPRIHA
jgi:hypothetical protein